MSGEKPPLIALATVRRLGLVDPEHWTDSACHASRGDGECNWARCPQIQEGEPAKTGRHCPLDHDAGWED